MAAGLADEKSRHVRDSVGDRGDPLAMLISAILPPEAQRGPDTTPPPRVDLFAVVLRYAWSRGPISANNPDLPPVWLDVNQTFPVGWLSVLELPESLQSVNTHSLG